MPRSIDSYDQALLQGRLWTPDQWLGTPKVVRWFDFSNQRGGLITGTNGIKNARDWSRLTTSSDMGAASDEPPYVSRGWITPERCLPCAVPFGDHDYVNFSPLTFNDTNGNSTAFAAYCHGTNTEALFSIGSGSGAPLVRFAGDTVQIVKNFITNIFQSPAGSCPAGHHIVGSDTAIGFSGTWIDGVVYSNTTTPNFSQVCNALMADNGTSFFSRPYGEAIFSSIRWTLAQREIVDGYLHWKWGLVWRLKAYHRFKHRPPLIGD
jgi:hypothetical protein